MSALCCCKGCEVVVAYYSKSLSPTERNYCTTRKELLAVIKSVKHFRLYLYGRPFCLRTDHTSLIWLCKRAEPSSQVARWLEVLENSLTGSNIDPVRSTAMRTGWAGDRTRGVNSVSISRGGTEVSHDPSWKHDVTLRRALIGTKVNSDRGQTPHRRLLTTSAPSLL